MNYLDFGISCKFQQFPDIWIDFIVDFESLGTMPETGDVITYNGKRYAVSAPSDEKCYRWHILNQSLRIHAQQVEENG